MPSTKISALAAATAPAVADLHVLATGGTNKKITTALLFHETLTRSAFLTKVSGSALIAGRWYRVTGCGAANNLTALVLATKANAYAREMFLDHATYGAVSAFWQDLTANPAVLHDSAGNTYRDYYGIQGTLPALNTDANFRNCTLDGEVGLDLTGPDQCSYSNTHFAGTFALQASGGSDNVLLSSVIDNSAGGGLALNRCQLTGSVVTKENCDAVLSNVELDNATLIITGTSQVTITNSRFSNCTVYVRNGAIVDSLIIQGKPMTSTGYATSYEVEGNLQNWVYDNWAGVVTAEGGTNLTSRATTYGTSSVRALLREDPAEGDSGWDRTTGRIYLFPANSVVGQYYLATPTAGSNTWTINDVVDALNHTQHAVELRMESYSGNTVKLDLLDYTAVGETYHVAKYHGATNKVGELKQNWDFVRLYANLNLPLGDVCWQLIWGAHYD